MGTRKGTGTRTGIAILAGSVLLLFIANHQDLQNDITGSIIRSGTPAQLDFVSGRILGLYNDITLDTLGNPVIAYEVESSTFDLRILKCGNDTCSSGNTITVAVDDRRPQYVSIALDTSDFPVVSYFDASGDDFYVLHCDDVNCAGSNDTPKLIKYNAGMYSDLVLDGAGNPVISYAGNFSESHNLFITHCNDPNCATSSTETVDSIGSTGLYNSIKLDNLEYPVISYYVESPALSNLKLIHCGNANCSSNNIVTTIDSDGDVGRYTSLVLDSAWNPVISYQDVTNSDLKLMHCNDPNCSGSNESTVSLDTNDFSGGHTSLVLDEEGFPIISYHTTRDSTTKDVLKILHCNDVNCAGSNEEIVVADDLRITGDTSLVISQGNKIAVSYHNASGVGIQSSLRFASLSLSSSEPESGSPKLIDATGVVGGGNSVAYDGTGNLVIAYDDDTADDLMVLHCNDPVCDGETEGNANAVETGDLGDYNTLAIPSSGNPTIFTASATGVYLINCNDTACAGNNETIIPIDANGRRGNMLLDGSENPIIVYYDSVGASLLFRHCTDAACAGSNNATLDASVSAETSISLVMDGSEIPVISYTDTGTGLTVIHCGDANCSANNRSNVIDTYGMNIGQNTLGMAGLNPVIIYQGAANAFTVMACNDIDCTGLNETNSVLSRLSSPGDYRSASLRLDGSNFPIIANYNATLQRTFLVRCNDTACSGSDEDYSIIDSVDAQDPSLVLGTNNAFAVSYKNGASDDLKITAGTYNNAPSAVFNSASQKSDGSSKVDISVTVSDANADPTWLAIEYDTDDTCNGPWATATLDMDTTTQFATVGSVPRISTMADYQIGAGTRITTSSDNTLQFDWHAGVDIPAANNETICLRARPNDGMLPSSFATQTVLLSNAAVPDDNTTRLIASSGGQLLGEISMVLTAAETPVIGWMGRQTETEDSRGTVNLLVCDDPFCIGGGETTRELASDTYADYSYGARYDAVDVTLNDDGYPILAYAYFDTSLNHGVMLISCTDITCSSSVPQQVNAVSSQTWGVSIDWDSTADLPVMVYDANGTDVTVARCDDTTCAAPTRTVVGTWGQMVTKKLDMMLDSNNYPVIVKNKALANQSLELIRCTSLDCSTANVNVVDTGMNTGSSPRVKLASVTEYPIIIYSDGGDMSIAWCNDPYCADSNEDITTYTSTNPIDGTWIGATLARGVPYATFVGSMNLMACNDATCATPVITTVESGSSFKNSDMVSSSANIIYAYTDEDHYGIQLAKIGVNTDPNAPTGLGPSEYGSGSATTVTTPQMIFTLSDPDVADTIQYRIQIDDSPDFSSPVVDYTSALGTQVFTATTFTVGQAAGSGTYTAGALNQALTLAGYYWRVKTIDDSAAESNYSTANNGAIAFDLVSGGRARVILTPPPPTGGGVFEMNSISIGSSEEESTEEAGTQESGGNGQKFKGASSKEEEVEIKEEETLPGRTTEMPKKDNWRNALKRIINSGGDIPVLSKFALIQLFGKELPNNKEKLLNIYNNFASKTRQQIPSTAILSKVVLLFAEGLSEQLGGDISNAKAYEKMHQGAREWYLKYLEILRIPKENASNPIDTGILKSMLRTLLMAY